MSLQPKSELEYILDEIEHRKRGRFIDTVFPDETRGSYEKHLEFFNAGKDNKIRLFLGGNRTGKSFVGLTELTYHVTTSYPDWWTGHRFTTASDWWILSPTLQSSVEIIQDTLLGDIDDRGTGFIPRERIDFDSLRECKKKGTSVGAMRVKASDGKFSNISFISAEMGRSALQGTARSVYIDEEVSEAVYGEVLTRSMTKTDSGVNNIVILTFTPLQGLTPVVQSFLVDDDLESQGVVGESKYLVRCTWDDSPHLGEEEKRILLDSIPPYQRDARSKGIPQLGSGAIYPVSEAQFVVTPFELPNHWPRGGGMDVGGTTAGVWGAWDRDSDTIYIYSDYEAKDQLPSTHAEAIKARGDWITLAIDTASHGSSQIDGRNLYDIYKSLGLNIINADKSVEAGIYNVLEGLSQGRIKIFNTCTALIKELRIYRRDDKGRIVKRDDHCCDSFRYLVHTHKTGHIFQTKAEADARFTNDDMSDHMFTPSSPNSWMMS